MQFENLAGFGPFIIRNHLVDFDGHFVGNLGRVLARSWAIFERYGATVGQKKLQLRKENCQQS